MKNFTLLFSALLLTAFGWQANAQGDCFSSGTYDYDNNEDFTNAVGFIANTPGDYITLTFTGGITESCCDTWFIMDAADGTGNVIATGPGSIVGTYESTTGEISFFVDSDGSWSPVSGGGTAGTTWDTFVYSLSCSPPPSCPDPSAGTATNITSSSADLAWTENGTATSWEVEWGAAAFTPGSGTAVITGTNPHALTGLTANYSYDFYVRAICGVGDTSAWAGPTSFTTLCPAAYTPAYLENFTSFVPGCWDEASDGTPLTGPTNNGSGDWGHGAYLNNGVTNDAAKINLWNQGTSDWLLSPNFDLSLGGPWQLVLNAGVTEFSGTGASAMGSDDSVQVVISTDGGISWIPIYTWDVNNTPGNTGSQYLIDLSAYTGTTNLFGIWGSEGAVDDLEDYDFFINDFEIRTPPLCVEPNGLAASNVTTTSADLGWTENGTATSWEIEYDTTGFVPGTGNTIVTGTNPHALTGLSANYSYDFYVRAICGVGDSSAWAGPYSFTTPCSVYTPQYLETYNTWVSPCWDQADAGSPTTTATTFGSSNWGATGFLNDGSGVGAVKINLYYTGTEDWMVSPTFDLSAGGPWELKIEAGVTGWNSTAAQPMGSDDMVQVVVSTDGGATWSVLHTWDATNQPSVNGEFLQLDLSAYTGTSNIFAIWAYDGTVDDLEDFDFHIGSFEIRTPPLCAEPSALTATNITSSSADLAWTAGGTETMWDLEYGVAPYAPTGTPTMTGVANPYNYSGLAPGTTYEFYVRADCGGANGVSAWAGPYSFTTYGDCASSGSYDYVSNSTMASSLQSFVANTPGDYITLNFSAGSTETGWDYWFIMDAADGTGNVIASGAGSIVGSYESTTGEISFYVDSDGSINGDTFVYDLSCSPPPSCPDPSALNAANITTTSADLGWTENGTATSWEIEYDTTGFVQGTGSSVVTGTNPHALTGLTANSSYDFYVRVLCGVGDTSLWFGPYSFSTYGDCASSGVYDYGNNEDSTNAIGFVANTPGDYITLAFTAGETESGWDYWFINDAADGSGVTIATGDGPITGAYESTTGEISFYVVSDGITAGVTFEYGLSCAPPCSGLTVDLGADVTLCSGQDSVIIDAGAGPYAYEWSTQETSQTIVVSDSAVGTVEYSVLVTDTISMCQAIDTVNITFDDCSNISELTGSNVSIYPNPSNGNFIISLSNISEQVSVQVNDMQGRLIYSQMEGLKVGEENVISLDNVERGVYLISVSSNKGRYTQSIVVQ